MSISTDTTIRIPQAAIAARPAPGDRLDEYLLQEPLGSSANALVFRAIDRSGANVALKIFLTASEAGMHAFVNEANAMRRLQLRHPQIICYSDFRCSNGYVYVPMPYCALGTLRDLLRRERLSRGDVLSILGQVAAGICFAHHHGLILGDVKPANILIVARKPPRIVLTDFSASQIYGMASLTVPNGTPRYAPPEQLAGLGAIQAWDRYGYGVTLVETALGRPFDESEPVDPRHLPQERLLKNRKFRELAEKLLSDVPAERPSMADVWETLEQVKVKSEER